jgi:hypothetical protein
MIVQLRNKSWQAQCDGCGTAVNTGLKSFRQAATYISRVEGWDNRELRGVWNNYCPACAAEADDLGIVGVGFTKRRATDEDY